MARSGRSIEYFVAAGFAIAAFFISPFGIKLFAGRADLTFRVNVISVTVVIFLTGAGCRNTGARTATPPLLIRRRLDVPIRGACRP